MARCGGTASWRCSIPSLLPPPAPFKIFVLLAGVVGISAARFATAIAIGRGVRYLALGAARGQIRRPGAWPTCARTAPTVVAGRSSAVLAAGFAAYLLWSKARNGRKTPIKYRRTR